MEDRNTIIVTHHSITRNSKRFNMHGKSRNEAQLKVDAQNGLTYRRFAGRERKWLLSKGHEDGTYALVSGRKCLIMSRDRHVVTVYPLPEWFGNRKPFYQGKKVIRTRRTYIQGLAEEFCAGF